MLNAGHSCHYLFNIIKAKGCFKLLNRNFWLNARLAPCCTSHSVCHTLSHRATQKHISSKWCSSISLWCCCLAVLLLLLSCCCCCCLLVSHHAACGLVVGSCLLSSLVFLFMSWSQLLLIVVSCSQFLQSNEQWIESWMVRCCVMSQQLSNIWTIVCVIVSHFWSCCFLHNRIQVVFRYFVSILFFINISVHSFSFYSSNNLATPPFY